MKPIPPTQAVKRLLGTIPYTADLYDALRKTRPRTRYNLSQLEAALPEAVNQARTYAETAHRGKKILLFATLHYWIEQAALIGLALRGMGHDVGIAYLPYADWRKELNAFDLRRQDRYTRRVLAPLKGLVGFSSLLGVTGRQTLPYALQEAVPDFSIAQVDPGTFRRQMDYLQRQTERNWVSEHGSVSHSTNASGPSC